MRKAALLIAVFVTVFSMHRLAIAQVQELPMVPMATGGWQDKFWTHADGTKFHYFEMGTGTPVILIHGSAAPRSTGCRTASAPVDVIAFMDALGIKRAHIGGFSMGGSITSQLMARAPERFITAHFGGSGVREDEGSEFAKMIPPDPKGTAPLDAEARKRYLARQAAEAAKAGAAAGEADASQLSSQLVPAAVPRPALDLTNIEFPVLAVVGEFDQPYARTHRLWREAKIFQRVILRNRGHLSSYMAGLAPELYRDSLTDFIVRNNPKK